MGVTHILVINPGSTSTRTALFEDERTVAEEYLAVSREELAGSKSVIDQVPIRTGHVRSFIREAGIRLDKCAAIAARGGPLQPVPGGVYQINEAMLSDAKSERFVEHVSKIACIIAAELAEEADIPAFVIDPVSTDEYAPVSRISGLRQLPRKSLIHALNLRAVARECAAEAGRPYEELNIITVQLGGGCSIAVHNRGRMIDSVDANGEGPFSPERSGGLRVADLCRLVLESKMSFADVRKMLTREGGFFSHLGTTDAREVEERAEKGDAEAKLVFEAMAYQVAKHIASLAVAVNGEVDWIVLTGGLANSKRFTDLINERVHFLAPVKLIPGEREMVALRDGVLRVLSQEERPRVYPSGEFI